MKKQSNMNIQDGKNNKFVLISILREIWEDIAPIKQKQSFNVKIDFTLWNTNVVICKIN